MCIRDSSQRNYWQPTELMKNQMQQANDDLEDRLEGVYDGVQVA